MSSHTRLPRRRLLAASSAAVTAAAAYATWPAFDDLAGAGAGAGTGDGRPAPSRTPGGRPVPRSPLPPNILLFTVDDLAAETAGCFGGRPDVTPALDRLAGQGVAFHQAHVPVAVCAPSRAALMTGRYPHRSGAVGFGPVDEGVPLLTELLYSRGYVSGILGKVDHLTPVSRYRWDVVRSMPELGLGRDPQRYAAEASAFFSRAASGRRPFFLMVNAHDAHRPFHGSREERETYSREEIATAARPSKMFTAREADVPGYLDDLPGVRTELAQYLSSARRADDTLAAVLAALDGTGQVGNTVVVVLADNGMAFPYAKANCYRQSTRTPLVVRWPGVTARGHADTEHFVSTLDLFPMLCRAAGLDPPGGLDGRDLTLLLAGASGPAGGVPWDRVHTVFHETRGRTPYEMRATHDARWSYLWNEWSDGRRVYRTRSVDGPAWSAMRAAAGRDRTLADRVGFFVHRAPEELYDLRADPHSRVNLARSPRAREALERHRALTYTWMRRTEDPLRERYRATVLAERPG